MKCKICNRYIEHKEFENAGVCSAICYGKYDERDRCLKLIKNLQKEYSQCVTYHGEMPDWMQKNRVRQLVLEELKETLVRGLAK